jgi:hypothetical protein
VREVYEVNVDDGGGFHHKVTCPLCPAVVQRATAHATIDALAEHMNAAHPVPVKRGH